MADVSVNIPPDGVSTPPHQPHAQDEWFMSLPVPEQTASTPIQRFPQELRRNDEDKEFYEPLAISIGPYHRQKKHLQPMRKWKALYAKKYIESKGSTFGDEYGKVERVAGEARKCYAGDPTLDDMSDLDFTRMMFLDGCFILKFITGEVDLGRTVAFVARDLLLLENQLPFTILMELEGPEEYNNLIEKMKSFVNFLACSTPEPETHSYWCPQLMIHRLLHLFLRLRAHLLVSPNHNMISTPQPETHSSPTPQPIHLLHFLRAYLLGNQNDNMVRPQPETTDSCGCPPPIHHLIHFLLANPNENVSRKRGDDKRWHTFRSVKELNKAGIDFRVSRSHRFSDVRFRSSKMWRGELELPPIVIHGGTKPILLNLMAYEMCCQDMLMEIPNVTSYIYFLDRLIDRPEDVMELRSKGILKTVAGSDQKVADLFNTITRNFTLNPEAYKDVKQKIEDQRKNRIKMWLMKWIDTYFEAPWSFISFVAAFIALALTSMQTYLAFRQSGNCQN